MLSKQITYTYKLFLCSCVVVFLSVGWFIITYERVKFWFGLISFILALRWISVLVASDFLLPLLMSKRISTRNKAVLITGCDSGFGNALAKRLDKVGFHVFAGCLYPHGKGAEDLSSSCSKRLRVVEMDVTQDGSVEKSMEFVQNNLGKLDLWAVVNNAGIAGDTFIELTPMKSFEDILNTNLLGVIRVTKAFLPFIRKSKGRIVNVTSVAGKVPVPTSGGYSISKCASMLFSDILRIEMSKFDVSVVTIEPWFYNTQLSDMKVRIDYVNKTFSAAPSEVQEAYGLSNVKGLLENEAKMRPLLMLNDLGEVVKDMEAAVMEETPQYTYGPGRWYFRLFVWFMTVWEAPPARDFWISRNLWKNLVTEKKIKNE